MVVHTTESWTRGDLLVRRGLRTTSPTRTLIDLAGQPISTHDLAHALDHAISQRWTSEPTVRRRVAELGGSG